MNRAQYCPSSAARRTGEKFWDIARLWAAPDDFILHLPDDGSLRDVAVPDWSLVTAIEPWGWDRHIVGVLRKLGAPERLLPSEAQLEKTRQLSSRETTVRVLQTLREQQLPANVLRAESRWCTTEEEVQAAIAAFGGVAMLKQPWSCSGRGVWRSDSPSSEARIRKTLREQGAVEGEPVYDNRGDFAMEFYAAPDAQGYCSVCYEGLSLFRTHEGGAYKGNVVASEAELRRQLEAEAGRRLPLDELSTALCRALSCVLADYTGPLGVDMMLTSEGIHPCIEVNLRNTMGRVAIFEFRAS